MQISHSTYAKYASSDTSKGTIEERLTNLGFKTGVAEITQTNCIISTNSLKKMGKWCIFNFAMSTSSSKKPSIAITIPVEFRPKEETKIILVQTNTSPMKAAYYRVLTNGKIGNFSSSVEFNPGYGVEEMFLNAWWELE